MARSASRSVRRVAQGCAIVLLAALAATFTAQSEDAVTRSDPVLPTLAPILKRIMPSIVAVASVKQVPDGPLPIDPRGGFPDPPMPQHVKGSGVIADAQQGLIVTAHHLVERTGGVTVTVFGGREMSAKVLATSPGEDLAVLRIEPTGLIQMDINQADDLETGDFVLAVGNPLEIGRASCRERV